MNTESPLGTALLCSYPLKQFMYQRELQNIGFNVTSVTGDLEDFLDIEPTGVACLLVDLNIDNAESEIVLKLMLRRFPRAVILSFEEDHSRAEMTTFNENQLLIKAGKRISNERLRTLLALLHKFATRMSQRAANREPLEETSALAS